MGTTLLGIADQLRGAMNADDFRDYISKDFVQVQLIAVQEGIPYHTLVSSIIHKYVSGSLVERKKA
jgi:hypothetical protein